MNIETNPPRHWNVSNDPTSAMCRPNTVLMSVLVLVSVYAFGNNLSMVIIVVYNFVRGQQPLEEDKYLVVSFKQFPQINVFHL